MDSFLDNLKRNKEVKRLDSVVDRIEFLAKKFESLSDEEIMQRTTNLKKYVKAGEDLYNVLPEAYALASEAIRRNFGFKPHRVQLMGAISLHESRGVEMKTGEGKTITGIFPAFLNALSGKPVHIMTSNEYLAKRDAETVKPVFDMLGMNVGAIDSSLDVPNKREVYKSDVVYGTTSNFGFDFLRENLVLNEEDKFTRGLGFAIIDEADSLLLDQARTPLILSEAERLTMTEYTNLKNASRFAASLTTDDVDIDLEKRVAVLNNSGIEKALSFYKVNTYQELFDNYLYYVNNALTAKFVIEKNTDYIIRENKVCLVDKNTARPLPTHKFSEGLHQAVEAKENVAITPESKTLGKITIQSFLGKYEKISGMSGTIKTSEEELRTIYNLDVVEIPTNKPVQRKDDTKFYFHTSDKYEAILMDVIDSHKKGQPVLLGTMSIEESEMFRDYLKAVGIECEVLNAKNLSREAEIVANAGRFGAVTIATDMAGRGTDIKLGGNVEVLAGMEEHKGKTIEQLKQETKAEREKVIAAGGLKVIGSSLHKLVRVDDQLRGRAGRQGEVGESVFYTSLDDDIFDDKSEVVDNLKRYIVNYLTTKDERQKNKILEILENLQEINESRDFAGRQGMLIYDREPSNQYDEFYELRNELLKTKDMSVVIANGANALAKKIIESAIESSHNPEYMVYNGEMYTKFKEIFNRYDMRGLRFEDIKKSNKEELVNRLTDKIVKSFNKVLINGEGKTLLLKTMDDAFMTHLKGVDMVKKHLSISSMGDTNPILTYEQRVHEMYDEMIDGVLPEVIMELIERTPQAFAYGKIAVPTSEKSY